ncbi:WxL domain-containing protein [Levilactobacillus angrenensis]|uniref:WxL domain-containing protein n=1 Tax=Levilactobacillus angrenensis TaxID=2486020 RepID=A0ABW1UC19_9LACO|nr:WxL domain-containing protein [Levilactobacillus angrenensis]
MTKKTLQLLASVALVAGLGMTTVTANAADVTADSGSVDTTAKVTLNAGDSSTDGNGDGDGGNVAGALAITSAPDVDFGSGTLNGTSDTTLTGTIANGTNSHNDEATPGAVTVVDPGTASGWNVQVSNSQMVNTADGATGAAKSIAGGTFTYGGAVLTGSTTDNAAVQDATSVKFDTAGTANQNVFHAEAGNGVGTWANTYKSANLVVPAGNAAGSYESTLTWTLTNTPETTSSTDAK